MSFLYFPPIFRETTLELKIQWKCQFSYRLPRKLWVWSAWVFSITFTYPLFLLLNVLLHAGKDRTWTQMASSVLIFILATHKCIDSTFKSLVLDYFYIWITPHPLHIKAIELITVYIKKKLETMASTLILVVLYYVLSPLPTPPLGVLVIYLNSVTTRFYDPKNFRFYSNVGRIFF